MYSMFCVGQRNEESNSTGNVDDKHQGWNITKMEIGKGEDRVTDREQCPSRKIVASSSWEQEEQSLAWHTLNNASTFL